MNSTTLFKTPNGEEMVVISLKDYEMLVKLAERLEDIEDGLAIKAFEERLARGEEEFIPGEFVDRMIDGRARFGSGAIFAVCPPRTLPRLPV